MAKNKTGFTLVELSIVLVIIGLLTGGILAAQSIISTVKIQRIVRDLQSYSVAVTNFKTKYKSLPGDSRMFTPSGNNDGVTYYGAGGDAQNCNGIYSNLEFWQVFAHLSQAGILSATYIPYSPQACGGTMGFIPEVNAGVTSPSIKMNEKYSEMYFNLAHTIIAFSNLDPATPNSLSFAMIAEYVIPLENKGAKNVDGAGQCLLYPDFSLVSCTDENAAYASMYYTVEGLE